MRLDVPTLFLMTVAVTFVVGVLYLLSWSQTRRERALAIWGFAHIAGSGASCMLGLRGVIPDPVSIGIGNAVIIAAYGLIWSGVRAFEGRRPLLGWALAGSALWIAACFVPALYASMPARVILASTLAGIYCALGAWTIWGGRAEPLISRYPALVLLGTYAAIYWVRIPLALAFPPPSVSAFPDSPWLAILCFVGTLYSVAIAFVLMALTKERAEREQRQAAETDALTGIANRRAFVTRAKACLAARPAALLLLDLDHFKAINDRYGHSVGDAVLTAFCHAAAPMLPRNAVFGRLGGEEFACLLPETGPVLAARFAESVRDSVGRIAHPDYPDLRVGVSVGIAVGEAGSDLDDLLRRADGALYGAKHNGRDQVKVEATPARKAVLAA
ncbi:GGDEF domain-containing protein [Methylorubrum sp. SB2]|uniref:GGDEF domain-containing protein n=1 Tax=Methylorubrum subtropicum TaxID=3138812 RepID=UPI00313AC779